MININSISKEYVMGDNKLLALNNVDVSIKEGEFVSIIRFFLPPKELGLPGAGSVVRSASMLKDLIVPVRDTISRSAILWPASTV